MVRMGGELLHPAAQVFGVQGGVETRFEGPLRGSTGVAEAQQRRRGGCGGDGRQGKGEDRQDESGHLDHGKCSSGAWAPGCSDLRRTHSSAPGIFGSTERPLDSTRPHPLTTAGLSAESLRWVLGLFCAFIGAFMLVAPHRYAGALYSGLAPFQLWWGMAALGSGVALLAVAVL